MRGVFDDEELEQPKRRRDAELTLGAGMLLLIFFGLVVVCGLCFGLGYAIGRHGSQPTLAAGQPPADGAQSPLQANGALPKPSATAQAAAEPAQSAPPLDAQPGSTDLPQSAAAVTVPVGAPQNSSPAASASGQPQGASPPSQPQVHPALAQQANPPQAAAAPHASPVVPAAVPLMVQIAAVTHEEDADVLVGALRKRGYAVAARRDPADNLIHVRIGPFNNRDEANRWRLKLLNDGYNAMIQP
jgi:cell division septation protein DedD